MSYRQQFGRIARQLNPLSPANRRALGLVFTATGGMAVGTLAPNIAYTGPDSVEMLQGIGLFLLAVGPFCVMRGPTRAAAEGGEQ